MLSKSRLLKGSLISGGTAGIVVPTALLFSEREHRDEYQQTKEMEAAKLVGYELELTQKDREIAELEHARNEELIGLGAASDTVGQLVKDHLGTEQEPEVTTPQKGENSSDDPTDNAILEV